MLGLGETMEQVQATLRDLRAHDVEMVTIGQYLQPSPAHHPLLRYWTPEEFKALEDYGCTLWVQPRRLGPDGAFQLPRRPPGRRPRLIRRSPPPIRAVAPRGVPFIGHGRIGRVGNARATELPALCRGRIQAQPATTCWIKLAPRRGYRNETDRTMPPSPLAPGRAARSLARGVPATAAMRCRPRRPATRRRRRLVYGLALRQPLRLPPARAGRRLSQDIPARHLDTLDPGKVFLTAQDGPVSRSTRPGSTTRSRAARSIRRGRCSRCTASGSANASAMRAAC